MGRLAVLHVDAVLIAVDKPPGKLVIPGRGAPETTVQEEVAAEHGRVWVVHRLDRWTSGVLLFARTAAAHRAVNLAFDGREVKKRYLALVRGSVTPEAVLTDAIAAGRRGRMKVVQSDDPRGKPAETRVRLLGSFAGRGSVPALSLVEALPRTGRTHQIRVHLAAAGTPLVIDPDYGSSDPIRDESGHTLLARTPLHAARLELTHPATGAPLVIEAPLPADMAALLDYVR